MPDTKDNRPFWKRNTLWGIAAVGASLIVRLVAANQTGDMHSALVEASVDLRTIGEMLAAWGIYRQVKK